MINELHLLRVPNFIAIGIYFLGFNVECVLLGRDFDFLGGYLVATDCYLSVTTD